MAMIGEAPIGCLGMCCNSLLTEGALDKKKYMQKSTEMLTFNPTQESLVGSDLFHISIILLYLLPQRLT